LATYTGRLDEPAPRSKPRVPSPLQRVRLESTLGRFLVAGGVSYLVNEALLYFLYESVFSQRALSSVGPLQDLDFGLLAASVLAVEVSILVRFLLNDSWTFRGRGGSSFVTRLAQSNLSSLGSPVIALACVNLMPPLLGISYLIANSLGVILGLAWNWTWSSRVIWRLQPVAEVAPIPAVVEEVR
jgi:putative flippase GtrA